MSINEVITKNNRILSSKATRTSMQSVIFATAVAILATLLSDYTSTGTITFEGLLRAQRENYMLWILDALPVVFGYLGQYASHVIAQEASLMVLEQTQELRDHANEMEKQAVFAATHDLLTDLPNRALFYDRLEQALQVRDPHLALLMLSIENLKEIHDTLGSSSCDLIIKQLATRLGSLFSKQDSVARIDSYRFAILLNGCEERDAAEMAARGLVKAIEPNFIINMLKLTLQPSIGIVVAPDNGDDADTLLQRAGIAEHFAGKAPACFSFYAPSMDEQSPRRLSLMGDLRRALERDELQLYYQPKVDLAKRSVIGVESLIRWKHPEHGFIPPDEFIGMAERTRMIGALSQWVLVTAFRQCARWQQAGHDLIVSINLSTKDLNDPELPDLIAGIMAKTEAPPEKIMFEITEGSIMVDPTRVLIIVERLRAMGFQFSIDDFGTGYSSLAYLKKLPVSELKIDKSFVMDMASSQNDRVIVRATVELAHGLGLKVTAEGIETPETLEILRGYGCDIGQGYLFSKPLSATDLESWCAQN